MLFWVMAALAQAPVTLNGPGMEVLYVAGEEALVSKRFVADAEPAHVSFESGKPLRVLFRENGWVRVRQADKFGWLEETQLTSDVPTPKIDLSLPPL